MKLHVFNPEHDLSLASRLPSFTPPHAARKLRADLGYLPALWASDDDVILVDDVDFAEKAYRKVMAKAGKRPCRFVDSSQIAELPIDAIDPWGWDMPLRTELLRRGVDERLMPDVAYIENVSEMSHRSVAAGLLQCLQQEGTTGEAFECWSLDEIAQLVHQYQHVVMKAPWSSSGRGIRFVENHPNEPLKGWINNLLQQQGSVMVEPYYNKVKDFGMEFNCDSDGNVRYLGLSLFETVNGAYAGNLLMTETAKQEWISRYISPDLLNDTKNRICSLISELAATGYSGPLGVDMMVVAGEERQGYLLHPCVEVNLRRTMGHVALAVSPDDDEIRKVMRIALTDTYKLKILKQ